MKTTTKKWMKWTTGGAALTLLVPVLAACNADKGEDSNVRHTLRVGTMYGSVQDDQYFRQQYTDMFEFSHSNIDIEVVPAIDYNDVSYNDQGQPINPVDPLEKAKAIMTGDNPVDVMVFDMNMLGALVNDNMLKQLDPLMKEDEIDIAQYVPSVVDGIKEQGNGFLYALTPTFSPSALFYNKAIFQKAGVEAPHDGMTWDEVFALAKRLKSGTGKDAKFGFSFSQWGSGDSFYDLQNYITPLQLRMYDDKAETMTVNTPQWESALNSFVSLYKDHVTPHQDDMNFDQPKEGGGAYNPYQGQLFLNGKVAMVVGQYSMTNDITQMNANADKLKIDKLQWDVVSLPSFAGKEGFGNVYLNSLAGINAKAANADDAWEFMKFMNGKDSAKFKSRSTYELSTLQEFVKPRDGVDPFNIDAFLKTKPVSTGNTLADQKLLNEKPNLSLMNELANRIFSMVISGDKTVKEALALWETKGNDVLQKIKTNPKGQIEGVFDDLPGGGGGVVGGGKPGIMY